MGLLSHGVCNLGRTELLSASSFHDKIHRSISAYKNVRNWISISILILPKIPWNLSICVCFSNCYTEFRSTWWINVWCSLIVFINNGSFIIVSKWVLFSVISPVVSCLVLPSSSKMLESSGTWVKHLKDGSIKSSYKNLRFYFTGANFFIQWVISNFFSSNV